jgi:transcriptional regulator with XRE-family HTH domain
MADKRVKNRNSDALRELRDQLYQRAPRGDMTVADAVKTMRKISGLTQEEFARHRGVSLPSLKQIERGIGNPTVETLNKLAAVYGLRVGLVPDMARSLPLRATGAATPSLTATLNVDKPLSQ